MRAKLTMLLVAVLAGSAGVGLMWSGTTADLSAAAPKTKLTAEQEKKRQAQLDALEPFNALISEWRGNGFLPGKDKNQGGWEESSQWVWQLKGDVAVVFAAKDAKVISKGRLTYDSEAEAFTFKATRVDGQEVTYKATLADDKKSVVFVGTLPKTKDTERLTIKLLDNIRIAMEVERAKAGTDEFRLLATVGSTKKGEKISGASDDGPKCVVTGGPGTSSVAGGYFVCCTGCRDAYNEDPAKWIALAKKKGYIK